NGAAASSLRVVSRTARLCTRGTTTSPIRAATRNPIPKYMIGSIMEQAPPTHGHLLKTRDLAASPTDAETTLRPTQRRGYKKLKISEFDRTLRTDSMSRAG